MLKVREFLRLEQSGGIILVVAALLAMIVANTGLAPYYHSLLHTKFTIAFGDAGLSKHLILWINDGLMAIFFMLVGLEIKREVLTGRLSSFKTAAFPAIAAIGGMAVPALIYVAVVIGMEAGPGILQGWAIPAATDIAFSLGVLALLGTRAPVSLKIFLMALAIIDDLGAIIIIALFYSSDLSLPALGIAALCIVALAIINKAGVRRIAPYILIGIVLWVAVLKSGVHATLAGVVVALAIPHMGGERSELENLEDILRPWVSFLILPIFAFANAGVPLTGLSLASLLSPLPLGIALGLFFGKQIGVMGASWLAVKANICKLPQGTDWTHLYGVSLLTGIGFTMSLFIGNLAFESNVETEVGVRIGVLTGSILSALAGYMVLRLMPHKTP